MQALFEPLPPFRLTCGQYQLDLSQPHVMGILNLTPDSFSDGGKFNTLEAATKQARTMQREGATIIDIGGESTRPHAPVITLEEELKRVLPVVTELAQTLDCVLSIDTSRPEVFAACFAKTPCIWNDVRSLKYPHAAAVAAELAAPVILMHSRGESASVTDYSNIGAEVRQELAERVDEVLQEGILPQQLILDMGFGFSKTSEDNLQLLKQLAPLKTLGFPLLMGISRKRVLGHVVEKTGNDIPLPYLHNRLYAGLGAALLAVQQGVSIIRTHDVAPTVQTLALWQAVRQS